MIFEDAWAHTMSWEGGSLLHTIAGDPGGETRYGLSHRAYPDLNLSELTEQQAQHIAKQDYWDKIRANFLPSDLRGHVFDMAFNAGVGRAARILQRAINMYWAGRRSPARPLRVDGDIGPITLDATAVLPHHTDRLVRLYKAYRVKHYLSVATGTPQFIDGWLRRAEGEYNG